MSSAFASDVLQNPASAAILERWRQLDLPAAWLVAGCLFQTVWNIQADRPPEAGIKDYDLFYFDAGDLSERGEQQRQATANTVLADLGVTLEVANQARVHVWYPGHFGRPYLQLSSSEDGIRRFLVRELASAFARPSCTLPMAWPASTQGRSLPIR